MNYLFRMKMAMLFFLNAVLLPLMLLNKDLFVSGAFILCFIFVQIIILISFATSEEATRYEWWTFAITTAASIYVFIILMSGRSLDMEWLGFLFLISYLVSAFIFLSPNLKRGRKRLEESGLSDEELENFRGKDEFSELSGSYDIPEAPKQSHLTDYPDFKKPKSEAIFREDLQRSWKDKGIMRIDENEGYYEIKPTVNYIPEEESEEGYLRLYPDDALKKDIEVKELDETPVLDVSALKKSRQNLAKKAQTIDEKIRLIAEKAILEGAQKKLERATKRVKTARIAKEKAILEKAQKIIDHASKKRDEKAVYSSITGDKYHTDRSCLALKRVKKKDVVLYKSPKDAQKQKLKACGICRR